MDAGDRASSAGRGPGQGDRADWLRAAGIGEDVIGGRASLVAGNGEREELPSFRPGPARHSPTLPAHIPLHDIAGHSFNSGLCRVPGDGLAAKDLVIGYCRGDGQLRGGAGMADRIENWRLILDAAQALTAAGGTPFTRVSIYEWIWKRYPRSSHDRPSLDPTFQGMVSNATGGPRSQPGTPLIRVGRGQYVLAGGRDEAGVTPVAPTERSGAPPHRVAASSLAEAGWDRSGERSPRLR